MFIVINHCFYSLRVVHSTNLYVTDVSTVESMPSQFDSDFHDTDVSV